MPTNRGFMIKLHKPSKPEMVQKDNIQLKQTFSKEELLNTKNTEGWFFDEEQATLYIKPCSAWYYNYDNRGIGKDVERDKVYWIADTLYEEGGYRINIQLPVSSITTSNQLVREHQKKLSSSGLLPNKANKYKLQVLANPPGIMKLDDGSWLDGHVNIFVSVTDSVGTIIDTEMPIKLRVTGNSDRIPAEREVKAIHGVAIFRDIFYKKPAKYIFHLSAKGIDPVDFPVY